MRSEYLYSTSLSDTVTIESVSSSGTTLTMPDIAGLSIGQKITVVGGNGEITLGTTITAINTIIDPLTLLYSITISAAPTIALTGATVEFTILPITTNGAAGINPSLAQKSSRNSIIKNFFSSSFLTETNVSKLNSTQTGTIQSSALVFNGPAFDIASKPRDFVSYVWKKLDGAYKYFGTRVRIIGNIESAANNLQTPVGSSTYYNVPTSDPTKNISLGGGSGGVCIADPNTNNGYYFEIAALTSTNIDSFLNKDANGNATISLNNILFYKIKKDSTTGEAIPVKLWGGIGNIIVDGGDFAGQYRVANETNPTVYDLAIEYIDINATTRKFFLYINNRLVQTVIDYSPIPITGNTMGVFVRGNTRCMFENVYALSKNYSSNSSFDTQLPISSVFGDDDGSINANESLNKYALSGVIQKTYINGISSVTPPAYSLYYDEFGTIMRECAYFNIKYDKAYPALFAKLSPTYNRLKSYVTSGFYAGSYGAEFLIFNATDSALNLDETTGNYLRIQGVTFTQDSVNKITVDDYYQKRGNLSNPELLSNNIVYNPYRYINEYDKIQTSRNEYGKNQFTLESPYIQNRDTAEELLGWLIEKNLRPRKAIGINIFPIPTLQIGDLVQINYKTDGIDNIAPFNTKFVVYNIEYTKSVEGPNMSVYLSEV
jgi:hypothetical protein